MPSGRHPSSSCASQKPVAFIQVDLDGLWAVRRCYGEQGTPEQDDPVYSHALPLILDLLDRQEIKATFFVVGADAQVTWKCRLLAKVLERGHEVANHSMTHDLELAGLTGARLEKQVMGCQAILKENLGVEAHGFRSPGYGFSSTLLETLARLGFRYDSSLLPTPWGWVMRWIRRRISRKPHPELRVYGGADRWTYWRMCEESYRDRFQYGRARGWRSPLRPYQPDARNPDRALSRSRDAALASAALALWEIPVSVSRRVRLPFHGGIGFLMGRRWVERAIASLRRGEGFLNYVMHGMDFVEERLERAAASKRARWFFGGSAEKRLDFFEGICQSIRRRFETCRTDQWVERVGTAAIPVSGDAKIRLTERDAVH